MLEKYTPLYLKYRPQSLAELVGQHSVAQTLINAIEHDRICHAYLFTGPRGTGKTSSARILAKSLNCEKGPTVTPCQTCAACREIKEGNSPAVFELDAASNNSVDDARSLIERAPLVAQGGRYKLYIIDECHMLTKEAFNALLKTIEEPPPGVIFVLATTEEHKVPPTIVSRCQRLMFKLVNQDELKDHLANVAQKEAISIDNDALDLIARRSGGGLRDALGLLDQAGLLSTSEKPAGVSDLLSLLGAVQEDVLLKISSGIAGKNGSEVLSAIHSLLLDGREPAVLIQEMAKHFLNLARSCYNLAASKAQGAHSGHAILGSPSYLAGLNKQAEFFDPAEIAQIVELLDKLEQNVRRSSQPAMNLEMGLLSICHRHEIKMLRELEERIAKLESALADNGIDMPSTARSGAPPGAKPALSSAGGTAQRTSGAPAPYAAASSTAASAGARNQSYTPPVNALAAEPAQRSQPTAPVPSPQPATITAPPEAREAAEISPNPGRVVISQGDDEDGFDYENTEPEVADVDDATEFPPGPTTALTAAQATEAAAAAYAPAQEPAAEFPRQNFTEEPREKSREVSAAPAAVRESPAPTAAAPVSASSTELEELWSDLTDALQGRHLPTFSILTTHAFPVAFEKNDLTIGVRRDQFQKMIENKAEHIKSAFTSFSGKTISVRVKVISESFAQPAAGRGTAGGTAARESRPKPQANPDDNDESDRGPAQPPSSSRSENAPRSMAASGGSHEAARSSDSGHDRSNDRSNDPSHDRSDRSNDRSDERSLPAPASDSLNRSAASDRPAQTERPEPGEMRRQSAAAAPRRAANVPEGDSGLISDAYKIFEGPGSRLIG